MARPVIIDCDPGIDDAVALCLALFDPRLEVVAVTATAGNVGGQQTSRNLQAIVETLDPPRWPRLGVCRADEEPLPLDARQLHGDDGLGNLGAQVAELHHQHPSDKVITDAIRQRPGQVTILALGPLTNIARALSSDPELAKSIDQIVMTGGTVDGIGNVTPSAEFNMFCDPMAARLVFRSPITKTLVPLDVTRRIGFTLDCVEDLPREETRAGGLLRRVVAHAFRAYRQGLGLEHICLPDAVTVMATVHPELFQAQEMAGDVETVGELTRGVTVFDRRPRPDWRKNMEVVLEADQAEVQAAILRGLKYAGQETRIDE